MFSNSNECIVFVSTDCSFVKIISYYLSPNFILNLCAGVVLQSIITLIDKFSLIKILLGCFLGSATSSYLMFSTI